MSSICWLANSTGSVGRCASEAKIASPVALSVRFRFSMLAASAVLFCMRSVTSCTVPIMRTALPLASSITSPRAWMWRSVPSGQHTRWMQS